MTDHPTVPLDSYREYPIEEMRERIERFYADMARRRTVREFSDRPVPRDICMWRASSMAWFFKIVPDRQL